MRGGDAGEARGDMGHAAHLPPRFMHRCAPPVCMGGVRAVGRLRITPKSSPHPTPRVHPDVDWGCHLCAPRDITSVHLGMSPVCTWGWHHCAPGDGTCAHLGTPPACPLQVQAVSSPALGWGLFRDLSPGPGAGWQQGDSGISWCQQGGRGCRGSAGGPCMRSDFRGGHPKPVGEVGGREEDGREKRVTWG